jgi:putative DNA primase/helicase
LDWRENGLQEPQEITQATTQYQQEQDTLGRFLAECCVLLPEAKIKASALLEAYQRWSGDKNMTATLFGLALGERGFMHKRGLGGNWFWQGIGLPNDQMERGQEG